MPDNKYEQIWMDVWNRITKNNIGADQINAFFSRLHPQAFSEGFIMLTADTMFIKNWVEANYKQDIARTLEEMYGKAFTVAIEVYPSEELQGTNQQPSYAQPTPQQTTFPQQTPLTGRINNQASVQPLNQETPHPDAGIQMPSTSNSTLNSDYRFDNFVVGSSNQLAYSMALAVAEKPGQSHLNPLFLHGKSGVGKTHLLRAIQNYVADAYPHLNSIYVDTMELVNDYTSASINKQFDEFKRRYNEADIIFIDDVQGLQGKAGTINMLFQLLNHMLDSGKQIVLSADRAPKNIDIDERSQTRFNSGSTCDIQNPEIETKMGITRNYIKEVQSKGNFTLNIDADVQEYIAENSSSNIRELKSAINKIFFYGQTLGKNSVTIEEVSQLLRDHFSGGAMKKLNVADVQRSVEEYYNISHADLVGKRRSANISHARQVGIYLSHLLVDTTLKAIAEEFNRNHSTVIYAITHIKEKCRESREMNEELEIIKKMIMEQ